jgi:GT2 family glycosyltransferase
MKLSVILVNYNVKHFLEQALLSVERASVGLLVETWVVDNNSTDDSVAMVKEKFPAVKVVANRGNIGFSKANNQAIRESKGEYVVLLNPDTVVSEDTFTQCIDFMDTHPQAGGLGVKTIDGSGTFLPESKRGFPSPWVAFCKSFGLSALFPKSPIFNRYHLGHLNKNETHEIDVLVGSFMFMRKTVLDKIGLLDEAFFMYGEDIDLSYRIVKGGFKNYYFAGTSIIHYKGESTKKGSLNYVRVFYGAMIIFAKKHFQGQKATVFIALMQLAVWFRASLTVISGIFKKINLPIFDVTLMGVGLFVLKDFWSNYYFKDPDYIKPTFLYFNVPLYISIWLSSIYFSGGYDKPVSLRRILRGVLVGTIILSAVYGFLDLNLRSSRMLIVLGAMWTGLSILSLRLFQHFLKYQNFRLGTEGVKNLAFIGFKDETDRAKALLNQAQVVKNTIGIISPTYTTDLNIYLGSFENLDDLIKIFKIEELIFCSKDMPYKTIIDKMAHLGTRLDYKILSENTQSIIGSSSKNTSGELYTMDVQFKIASPMNRRNKRLLDVVLSILGLIFSPILIFLIQKPVYFLQNLFQILIGNQTFVGYTEGGIANLPKLKKGLFSTVDDFSSKKLDVLTIQRVNFFYAKDYSLWQDVGIVLKRLKTYEVSKTS